MGSLVHPVAEKAREYFARREFLRATNEVEEALFEDPGHPDLACESAILSVYAAKEEIAFEFLPIAEQGVRFGKLISLLADHYTSRILLDRTDHDARRRLQLLRTFQPKESKHIGVKISACLIVKNEEKTLSRCLTSLQGKVDQIVVVDTGSTDSTVSIARSFGARVADFKWCDDFSAARNFALSLANANWILYIDADEELTAETKAAFERAVVRPQFGGFDIEIVNYLDTSSEGEQFRHCPTRLFRNVPGVHFQGRIHEQINPSLLGLGLPWARLEGATILHHGYVPEVMNEKSKVDRTIALLEREVKDYRENAFQWFNLANAYIVGQRYEEAASAARSSLNLLSPSSGFAISTYSILIQSLKALGRYDEALEAADEAFGHGFDCVQIAFEQCGVLIAANRYEEALDQSSHMLSLEWPQGSTGDYGIYTHKRFILCAQILANLNRFEEALVHLERAATVAPDYGPVHFIRGQVLERMGSPETALESFRAAAKDPSYFVVANSEAARLLARQGRLEEAAQLGFAIWTKNVGDVERWADWKRQCEATGNAMMVLECYEQFAALQSTNAEFLVDWGRACVAVGKNPQAIKCFNDAILLDSGCSNAYFNCGDLLYRIGMAPQAVEIFKAGLALRPDYVEGWFVLANALARSDRLEEAVEIYGKVLDMQPNHDRARHNLTALKAA